MNEPTFEQIAEWLIDCADCFDMIDSEIRDNPFGGYSRRCREYAARVEAMSERRCGTYESLVEHPDFDNFIRAFWRRVEPYKHDYGKELPEKIPVEFRASMETALLTFRER